MKNAFDKMISSISGAIASKVSFEPEKVAKRFKYNILRNISEGDVKIVVANQGKVFDGLIIANNQKTGEKVMILIRQDHELPFTVILNSSIDNDLKDYVDAVNNNVSVVNGNDISESLKNKSLKKSLLVSKIKDILM